MSRSSRPLALVLIALVFLAQVGLAGTTRADVPVIATPVVDGANVLGPADEERVAAALVALRTATGVQMAVLTIDTLAGRPIEDFAQDVFARWGGGSRTRDDGVLFVLAVGDRQSRLQVGYGIEPLLTDARAATLLADLRPALRASDFAGACAQIVAAVSAEVAHLTPESGIEAAPTPLGQRPVVFGIVAFLAWLSGALFMGLRFKANRDAKKKRSKKARKAKQAEPAPAPSPETDPAPHTAAAVPLVARIAARLGAIPSKLRAWFTWALAPMFINVIMSLVSGLDFGVAYLVAWYPFALAGVVAALVFDSGRVRTILMLSVLVTGVVLLAVYVPAGGIEPLYISFGALFGGLLMAVFTAMFIRAGAGGLVASGSSYSSSSSGYDYSSSSSSSYASSSSSSSYASSSWDGGGGSSGGGGASSSW